MFVCETTWYNSLPSDDARAEHLSYIRKKGEEGKVALSGRFADSKGALIIWRVSSLKEAEALAKTDPYHLKGLIRYELREWVVVFNYLTSSTGTPQ